MAERGIGGALCREMRMRGLGVLVEMSEGIVDSDCVGGIYFVTFARSFESRWRGGMWFVRVGARVSVKERRVVPCF